ncbi:eukaryotic translation initiation factor 5B-like [Camellia sinensis]|uniref:eukaryotic translation initiation factor 5B-like n=1 Tax=Camellia sinensis TaxID=4442 RepID=UPI001036D6D7|nr:eukaryotic translation initiation factor 5B-like [Camellia sinensis]
MNKLRANFPIVNYKISIYQNQKVTHDSLVKLSIYELITSNISINLYIFLVLFFNLKINTCALPQCMQHTSAYIKLVLIYHMHLQSLPIGPVHKKDVMKASVILEKKKEYATILAFDVKVTPEAQELADEVGVKIFIADIIYHLFDQFKAYIDNLKEEKKKEASEEVVFPCILKIMPNCVFNKKDSIILGVDVLEGIAKVLNHHDDHHYYFVICLTF